MIVLALGRGLLQQRGQLVEPSGVEIAEQNRAASTCATPPSTV